MTRKEFLKICGILGVSLPFQASLSACGKEDDVPFNFTGKVIIIGAGAGGLSAGYLLQQHGVDVEILEASPIYGGRMRINTNFTSFPIPLGAEWIETNPKVFKEIVNDSSVQVNVATFPDLPDLKFVNSSWFNFYDEYIIPSIIDKIKFNTIVDSIDYSGTQVVVNTQNGQYFADKVIVSVPLKILQTGALNFIPNLPQYKQDAINEIQIWDGFKAFFKFSTKFYADEYDFPINPSGSGEKLYYNAALGQNTLENILGFFVVGAPSLPYTSLTGNALRDFMLNELDGLYNNQASPNYISHVTQNWNDEPFIKGAYMSDYANWKTVKKLGESVANKIYFAGGEYTDGEDWVSVHTAAQSAKTAIELIGK